MCPLQSTDSRQTGRVSNRRGDLYESPERRRQSRLQLFQRVRRALLHLPQRRPGHGLRHRGLRDKNPMLRGNSLCTPSPPGAVPGCEWQSPAVLVHVPGKLYRQTGIGFPSGLSWHLHLPSNVSSIHGCLFHSPAAVDQGLCFEHGVCFPIFPAVRRGRQLMIIIRLLCPTPLLL